MRNPFFLGLMSMVMVAGMPLAVLADTGFRGDGSGQYQEVSPPLHWGTGSNIVWSVHLGMSNASPVILGDRIFICEEQSKLLAFSLADGKSLWSVSNGYADVLSQAEAQSGKYTLPPTHQMTGYTSPTPVTDGVNVYAVYCSGVVVAVTPEGKRLWGRVLPVRPHHEWGQSASPRLADGVLLVHFGNKVFALDAKTGADKWVADAPSGFGSPVVAKVDGTSVVITPKGDIFAVADGRKLASSACRFRWNGPVVLDNVIYKIDENDGAAAWSLTFDTTGKLPCLWTMPKVPKGRYYATAIAHDGLVYNVCQDGTLLVLDAKTGTIVYQQALNLGGCVYSSPALAGGRLYISSDTGMTVVVKPGRIYGELARNPLQPLPIRASAAFCGDSLFIRTTGGLCRIQEKK